MLSALTKRPIRFFLAVFSACLMIVSLVTPPSVQAESEGVSCSELYEKVKSKLLVKRESLVDRAERIKSGCPVIPNFIGELKDDNPDVRSGAATVLGNLAGLRDSEEMGITLALIEALKDKDSGVRSSTAEALGAPGLHGSAEEKAIPGLTEALKDEAHVVRSNAAATLTKLLSSRLRDGDPDVRLSAAATRAEVLAERLKDDDPGVRSNAAVTLGRMDAPPEDSVPALIDTFKEGRKEGESSVCVLAAESLGMIGPDAEDAVPTLVKALEDEDYQIRGYSAEALAKISPGSEDVLAALISMLHKSESVDRAIGARSLGIMGSDAQEALPALKELLSSLSVETDYELVANLQPEVFAAIEQIEKPLVEKGEISAQGLITDLKNEDPDVRWDAARALLSQEWGEPGWGDSEMKAVIPALLETLEDNDKRVRMYAAQALGAIFASGRHNDAVGRNLALTGPAAKNVTPVLITALSNTLKDKDEDMKVRGSTAGVLCEIGPDAKDAVPALIGALKDDNLVVRASTAIALGEIGPDAKDAVPALSKVLVDDEESLVRMTAAQTLGKMGPDAKDAVPALIKTVKDVRIVRTFGRGVSKSAVEALGNIGPDAKEAVPALLRIYADQNQGLRNEAARAIKKIGIYPKEAVPALIDSLKDDEDWVRWQAAVTLGRMGPDARDAIPALFETLEDENEDVRSAAAKALDRIENS